MPTMPQSPSHPHDPQPSGRPGPVPSPSTWTNWSGSVQSLPRARVCPTDESELAEHVVRASRLRVVGAGHSFTPLCETSGTLVDLRRLAGAGGGADLIELDAAAGTAWVPAWMSLADLTRALWDRGYSLPNQGDVNPQSLAGALATGTHGTGADLGCLSTFARAFRWMLADGSVVLCSPEQRPELFEAGRLSLGLLGIALSIQIALVPAFRLEERVFKLPLDGLAERFAELAHSHQHAEFFVFPYADHAIVKTLHPTQDQRPVQKPPPWEEPVFKLICDVSVRWPALTARAQRLITRLASSTQRVGPAFEIFPSERTVRFEEMEYEVPRAAGFAALQEAIACIRAQALNVTFPFEFRWVAGDDLWLSPFNRGPCAAVSFHQYSRLPWRELFATIEPIFLAHGGRPHWGKRHSLKAADVRKLYPMAERFSRVRESVDPTAKLANSYLRELFDIEPTNTESLHAG